MQGLCSVDASLSVGFGVACLRRQRVVHCWGANASGQTGHPSTTATVPFNLATPPVALAGVTQVATGQSTTVLLSEGVVYWMGRAPPSVVFSIEEETDVPTAQSFGTSTRLMRGVSVGFGDGDPRSPNLVCGLAAELSAWCWGDNLWGQLGIGSYDEYEEPVLVRGLPTDGRRVTQVNAGGEFACAVLDDGSVWCWGRNGEGQLGIGVADEFEDYFSPRQVVRLADVVQISGRLAHTCALSRDRQVRCWGRSTGVHGTPPERSFAVPTPTRIVRATAAGEPLEAVQISCGSEHCCARTLEGRVECWGHNGGLRFDVASGQSVQRSVVISGLPVVVEVGVGDLSNYARTADGALWHWGVTSPGGRPERLYAP